MAGGFNDDLSEDHRHRSLIFERTTQARCPTVPKGRRHSAPQSQSDAGTVPHSPEGTQAYSRQPGLAVPSTIDSESSEGAQADHASPHSPKATQAQCPTVPKGRRHIAASLGWRSQAPSLQKAPKVRRQTTHHPPPQSDAGTVPHSPKGTQAYSRQPGLAVPSTIASESSEGAQAQCPTVPKRRRHSAPQSRRDAGI